MLTIALDGPAGAGKSTIARKVAEYYHILYLDTGAMYRAIGWKALTTGIPPQDPRLVEAMLGQTRMDIEFIDGCQHVFIDGKDVSELIRTSEMSRAASDISALPCVRKHLVELQRQIASKQPLVIDGRDIGTYVLPDASWKFFLTASAKERAHRRLLQLREKGDTQSTLADICADIEYRDLQDSTRTVAPLRQAADAILIDSTDMSIKQVVDKIVATIGDSCRDVSNDSSETQPVPGGQ